MLTGGCYCGQVRYEAEGAPFHETICHCADCRRVAGAPAVAWFSVPAAGLRFVAAKPRRFRSSAHATRSFCPNCGTSLTFQSDSLPDEIDITTASLDQPEMLPPRDHTHAAGRLPWLRLADGLPRYATTREDGPMAEEPPAG